MKRMTIFFETSSMHRDMTSLRASLLENWINVMTFPIELIDASIGGKTGWVASIENDLDPERISQSIRDVEPKLGYSLHRVGWGWTTTFASNEGFVFSTSGTSPYEDTLPQLRGSQTYRIPSFWRFEITQDGVRFAYERGPSQKVSWKEIRGIDITLFQKSWQATIFFYQNALSKSLTILVDKFPSVKRFATDPNRVVATIISRAFLAFVERTPDRVMYRCP